MAQFIDLPFIYFHQDCLEVSHYFLSLFNSCLLTGYCTIIFPSFIFTRTVQEPRILFLSFFNMLLFINFPFTYIQQVCLRASHFFFSIPPLFLATPSYLFATRAHPFTFVDLLRLIFPFSSLSVALVFPARFLLLPPLASTILFPSCVSPYSPSSSQPLLFRVFFFSFFLATFVFQSLLLSSLVFFIILFLFFIFLFIFFFLSLFFIVFIVFLFLFFFFSFFLCYIILFSVFFVYYFLRIFVFIVLSLTFFSSLFPFFFFLSLFSHFFIVSSR